ncbi:MAG: hypothetical protein UY39_C0018G0002 [Candidatus Kaiserbacteria bacterium GW2011_GWC2_49_12]|uniref:Transcriptional repressor PaaX-like central Cas2-like domain-containing protein n=1 Tax=Candidatus Kaiserbacteria bacterium GW2011_GWC2_49_12 TaxID=1618675 RepID=A0A0G1YLH5_9BACT|nr:MAG: hypothetical protein UY39_C0018G0002 [Candidatus Kaiserbacteria bacterium GW2011_GWC2_49_12]HCM43450.1 CRISPR-associated endonuclease Cas2 [Candidatus Kaiserbacteria bacterium]
MGKIEEKAKQKTKKNAHVQDAILLYFRTVGAMAAVILSPNPTMYKLLRQMDPNPSGKRNATHRIREAAKRLEAGGLLKRDHKGQFVLTRKGEQRSVFLESMQNMHMMKPRHWDEKWRIVIFDVWERRRGIRQRLRALLEKAGFVRLQDSVWVYPYPCEEFVAFIRADLRLGPGMLYIIAEEIEHDRHLKEHFGIPIS